MSDFLPHTFTRLDNTEFKSEFIALVNSKDTYLRLTPPICYQGAAPSWQTFVLGVTKIIYKTGTNSAKIARFEQSLAKLEANIAKALEAEQVETYIMGVSQRTKLINMAQGADESVAMLEVFKNTLASFTPTVAAITNNTPQKVQSNLAVTTAHLNYAIATINLKKAIETSFGKGNYQIVKWVGRAITVPPYNDDVNNIILNLRKPDVVTRAAIVHGATSATLRAYINPRHVQNYGWFEYGTTIAYGTFLPLDPANMGSGTVDASLTQLPENLTPETTYHYRAACSHLWLGQFFGEDVTFTTLEAVHPVLPITVYCTGGYTGGNTTLANGLVDPNGCTPVSRGIITTEADIGSTVDVNGAAVLAGTPYSSVEAQAVDATGTLVYSGHTFHNSGSSPVSMIVTYADCVEWIAAGSIFAGGGAWCNNKMGD